MKRLLTLLALTIAFAACKKEDKAVMPVAPAKPVPYLTKSTYFNTKYQREMMLDSVLLDGDGNLQFVAGFDYYGGLTIYSDIFTKDKFGRIIKAEGYYSDYDVIGAYPNTVYNFEYDDNSNIVTVISNRINMPSMVTTYTYDERNRIAKEEIVYPRQQGENKTRVYTYSDPATLNPATMTETGADPKDVKQYIYTYDGKPSPYTTLPRILYYMGIGQLAVNNIVNISVRDANSTTTNMYRYDANGLPFNKQSNLGEEFKYYYGER